jgi:hypothetical protein
MYLLESEIIEESSAKNIEDQAFRKITGALANARDGAPKYKEHSQYPEWGEDATTLSNPDFAKYIVSVLNFLKNGDGIVAAMRLGRIAVDLADAQARIAAKVDPAVQQARDTDFERNPKNPSKRLGDIMRSENEKVDQVWRNYYEAWLAAFKRVVKTVVATVSDDVKQNKILDAYENETDRADERRKTANWAGEAHRKEKLEPNYKIRRRKFRPEELR